MQNQTSKSEFIQPRGVGPKRSVMVADDDSSEPAEDDSGSSTGSDSDTQGVADGNGEETSDGPGEAWTCTCGAENAPDRAVCQRCVTRYEDIDQGE